MASIVVDPHVTVVTSEHLADRYPDAVVDEGEDAISRLRSAPTPTAFITSNTTWDDTFLTGLEDGDWITSVGSGYDSIPLGAVEDIGVAFTNSPGVNAPQIGEQVFAMAFMYTRQLWELREQQQEHVWSRPFDDLTDLAGDVCCVVGLGHVGETVAERATAFEMTVRGIKQHPDEYDGIADEVYGPGSLTTALEGARLVVLAVPLTEMTRHLIGTPELAATASDAILINVARGPVVDTDALLAALEDDELRAACLDVTEPEPLPQESPLWDRQDIFITPHTAGLSKKYSSRFLDRFDAQYKRWRQGKALNYRVV